MSKIIPSSYELLQFYVYYIDWLLDQMLKTMRCLVKASV